MQFPHGDDYRIHWEAEHLQYAIEQNELRRAKKENIEVSISLKDIEIPDLCPELKIKIEI